MNRYPYSHLFEDAEWRSRLRAAGIGGDDLIYSEYKKIRVASRAPGALADIESWPSRDCLARLMPDARTAGGDWLVFKKLLPEMEPLRHEHYTGHYSVAPYLLLTEPLRVKKEVLSHIHRTGRKISREVGDLDLQVATEETRSDWFETWSGFQRLAGRFSESQLALFRKWTVEMELPAWMRLYSLMAGNRAIAAGLFYEYDKVFYYYSPVMSQDADLRKYGPGKLFTQKLIEDAVARGCTVFDFLQGGHEYKFHWNPHIRNLKQCIVPISLKGHAALAAFRAVQAMKSLKKPRPEKGASE